MAEELKLCDTTSTPRVAAHWCMCVDRTDMMGPCLTWEEGSNGRCAYCDHDRYCHQMLKAARGENLDG